MAELDECVERISALSTTLRPKRAKEFLQFASETVEAARATGKAFDEIAVINEAADTFFAKMVKEAEMAKWHSAINAKIKRTTLALFKDKTDDEIINFVNHIMIPKDGRSAVKGGVETKSITLNHIAITRFAQQLEKQGLDRNAAVRYLRKHANGREIMRASYDPDYKAEPEARVIATAMEDTANFMRRQANRYGADIAKLPGYLFRQSHDRYKIQKAGEEKWAEFIVDKLDAKRTFDQELTRPQKIERLKNSYATIVTSSRSANEGVRDFMAETRFTGPENLAKQLSHSRNLHFKNGDAAFEYMQEFGYPDVGTAFVGGLEMMGRNTAAMMHLGPNAKSTLFSIAELARKRVHPDNQDKIRSNDKLSLEFDEVMGTNSIMPGTGLGGKLARGANWVRNLSSSAVLGGISITSLSDIGTSVARLGEFGVPLAQAHADMLTGMFQGRREGEVREIADSLNIGLEYLMDSVSARFLGDATGNAQGASLVSKVFHITGMNWLSDTMKSSAGLSISNFLAKQTAKPFNSLNEAARLELQGYGINKDNWSELGDAVRDVDGKKYIDADNIKNPDTQLLFQTFITGFVNSAVLTPGARMRLRMRAGRERGTAMTEMSLFFFHLKSYSITYLTEILSRGLVKDGKLPAFSVKGAKEFISDGRFVYVAHLISSMIVYGTIVNMLKDTTRGQKISIDSSDVWRGMMTSGGLGFYGDLLNAFILEEKQFGIHPAIELLGPIYGSFDNLVLKPANNIVHGEFDKVGASVYRGAKSMVPFANLFYTRLGLDYFLLWEMNEAIRPGWANAHETRMREEYGREYLDSLRPTRVVPGGLLN